MFLQNHYQKKINHDKIAEIYYKERTILRDELNNLKQCQLQYFTFSLTATGIILGLIAKFDSANFPSILFLLPLTVLLPSWLVFFDKAKTITRIQAYYRILETLIIDSKSMKKVMVNGKKFRFVGWENSVMFFRKWESRKKMCENEIKIAEKEKEKLNSSNKDSPELIEVKKTLNAKTMKLTQIEEENEEIKKTFEQYRSFWDKIKDLMYPVGNYWRLVYASFFGVSIVCISIPAFPIIMGISNDNVIAVSISVIVFVGAASYNFCVLKSLISGKHAYERNFYYWCKILGIDYTKINELKPAGLVN